MCIQERNNCFVGIDVGGMSVKGGVVDKEGNILFKTVHNFQGGQVLEAFYQVSSEIYQFTKINRLSFNSFGVGVPCLFDQEAGTVAYGNNIDFQGLSLKEYFRKTYGKDVLLCNDADAAAMGEMQFGEAQGMKNIVLVTIGTGIGGGIIVEGKPLSFTHSAAGEVGHMVLKSGGKKCNCGRKGCFEAYCSMPALYKSIRTAMRGGRDSLLKEVASGSKLNGEKFFSCLGKDYLADKVFSQYVSNFGEGIVNLANIFRPQIVLIGGGVSLQGEKLVAPIREYVNKYLFAKEYIGDIKVKAAKFHNDAGILGAAALTM